MVAPNVVASTIHPIAVLPIKGMGRDTISTRSMALTGICLSLRAAKRPGRIPSCATA